MKNQMHINTLVEFGLSEKEAAIYLALIELEQAGAGELANQTKINRSSVYVALESLKELDLVKSTPGNYTPNEPIESQKFIASSPDALLKVAKARAQKESDIERKIESVVPVLKALHKDTRYNPQIQIFEGSTAIEEGAATIFSEQVARGMTIHRFYGPITGSVSHILAPRLRQNDIEVRVLTPKDFLNEIAIVDYQTYGSKHQFKFIAKEETKITTTLPTFGIYEDKIEFYSDEGFLVVIENQAIAHTLKNVFDVGWLNK